MSTENQRTFKVIIAGGRDFKNYNQLKGYCDYYLSNKLSEGYNIQVVSGRAKGADRLGERYAEERGFSIKTFPADWNKDGKVAGFIRNGEMADYGDVLIAFWDQESRGTANMIEQAKEKGLFVRIVEYKN